MENISYIPARIKNAAVGGHVAGAVDIYDDLKNENLQEINASVDEYINNHINVSSFINDIGYLTQHQSLENYATSAWVNLKLDDILGINAQQISELSSILSDDDTTTGILKELSRKSNSEDLSQVATSGNYNDLTNIPYGMDIVTRSEYNQLKANNQLRTKTYYFICNN